MKLYFVVFIFIIIIGVIILSSSIQNALLILGAFANILIICMHSHSLGVRLGIIDDSDERPIIPPTTKSGSSVETFDIDKSVDDTIKEIEKDVIKPPQQPVANEDSIEQPVPKVLQVPIFGHAYKEHSDYIQEYSTYSDLKKPIVDKSPSEILNGPDERIALMNQQRTRDKSRIDGQLSKTANFYKYYYSDELGQQERRQWWGNIADEIYEGKYDKPIETQ